MSKEGDSPSNPQQQLLSEFVALYRRNISEIRARRPQSENIHYSQEERAQAAFVWLFERLLSSAESGEKINSLKRLFWKSGIKSERKKTERYLKKQWLLMQKQQIQSGSGAFRAPRTQEECAIGVGRRVDCWQDNPLEKHIEIEEQLQQLRIARQKLNPREELALAALVSGLTSAEAAATLGISETNFRQIVFRIRRKLQQELKKT